MKIEQKTNGITIASTTGDYSKWLWTPFEFPLSIDLNKKKLPKEYYINEKKKTVVLKWNDDTITKVKTSKDDKFDAVFGFLLAYFQKHCDMSRTQANKYLENVSKSIEKEEEKK